MHLGTNCERWLTAHSHNVQPERRATCTTGPSLVSSEQSEAEGPDSPELRTTLTRPPQGTTQPPSTGGVSEYAGHRLPELEGSRSVRYLTRRSDRTGKAEVEPLGYSYQPPPVRSGSRVQAVRFREGCHDREGYERCECQ